MFKQHPGEGRVAVHDLAESCPRQSRRAGWPKRDDTGRARLAVDAAKFTENFTGIDIAVDNLSAILRK